MADPKETSESWPSRAATAEDLPAMSETLASAFHDDPVWGPWAFPDESLRPAQQLAYWDFFLRSALRYEWVHVTPQSEAVTLWIPPGGTELTSEEEERARDMVLEMLGDHGKVLIEGFDVFDASHPREEPHYYLSLWGTHGDHLVAGSGRRCSARTSIASTPNTCLRT